MTTRRWAGLGCLTLLVSAAVIMIAVCFETTPPPSPYGALVIIPKDVAPASDDTRDSPEQPLSPIKTNSPTRASRPYVILRASLPDDDELVVTVTEEAETSGPTELQPAEVQAQQRTTQWLVRLNLATGTSVATAGALFPIIGLNEGSRISHYDDTRCFIKTENASSEAAFFDTRLHSFVLGSFDGHVLVAQLPKLRMRDYASALLDRAGLDSANRLLVRIEKNLPAPVSHLVLYGPDLKPAGMIEEPLENNLYPGFVSGSFGSSPRLFCALGSKNRIKKLRFFSLEPFKELASYPLPAEYVQFFKNRDSDCLTVMACNEHDRKVTVHVLNAAQLAGEPQKIPLARIDEISLEPDPYKLGWTCTARYVCRAVKGTRWIELRPIGEPDAEVVRLPFDFDDSAGMCPSGSGRRLLAWNCTTIGVWDLGEAVEQVGLYTIESDAAGNPVARETPGRRGC